MKINDREELTAMITIGIVIATVLKSGLPENPVIAAQDAHDLAQHTVDQIIKKRPK